MAIVFDEAQPAAHRHCRHRRRVADKTRHVGGGVVHCFGAEGCFEAGVAVSASIEAVARAVQPWVRVAMACCMYGALTLLQLYGCCGILRAGDCCVDIRMCC